MHRQNYSKILIVLTTIFLSACSLDYVTNTSTVNSPELILHNVEFSRVEDGHLAVRLYANTIESYRKDNSLFAENVYFTAVDKDGELVSNGNAEYLFVDQNNDLYSLLNGVKINSPAFDTLVEAKNLRWNGETEQLTSTKHDVVRLTRGSLDEESANNPSENTESLEKKSNQIFIIEGSGFTSDMFTQDFSFNEYISGSIIENATDIEEVEDINLITETNQHEDTSRTQDFSENHQEKSIEEILENDK